MGVLDLRDSEDARGRMHYAIEVKDHVLVYAYIRKNGCSAFKNFFIAESPHEMNPGEGQMAFMARCHRAREVDLRSADYRICVLRKPHSRAISVYRNKFIQQVGNADIFANYEKIVGQPPQDATFQTFVEGYLSADEDALDPHLYSQASHLLPIRYNQALILEDLAPAMSELVGFDIAARHFIHKANATSTEPQSDQDVSGMSAAQLHAQYRSTKQMPSTQALCPPELRATIEKRYDADCRILEQYVPAG